MNEEKSFNLINKHFTSSEGRGDLLCKSYIFKPSQEQEKHLGRFFISTEIDMEKEKAEKIFKLISATFQRNYFSENTEENPGARFENALDKTNQTLITIARENEEDWFKKIHIIISVICQDHIYLSAVGNAKAFIVRAGNIIEMSEGLADRSIESTKIFANTLEGTLKDGDRLIFMTPRLLDFLTLEKVKKTIEQFNPELASIHLKETLEIAEKSNPISALIIEVSSSALPGFARKKITPEELKKEKETASKHKGKPERVDLQDKDLDYLKNYPSLDFNNEPKNNFTSQLTNKTKKSLSSTQNFFQKYILPFLTKIGSFFSDLFSKLAKKIKRGRKKPLRSNIIPSHRHSSYNRPAYSRSGSAGGVFSKIKRKFLSLPRSSQAMVIIIILLSLTFLISIIAFSGSQQEEEKQTDTNQAMEQLLSKTKEASDALIYNDNETAISLLTEAQTIIEQNPDLKNNNPEEIDRLEEEISKNLALANHINLITDPLLVAKPNPERDIDLAGFSLINGKIYSYNNENGKITTPDSTTKEYSDLSTDTTSIGEADFITSNAENNSLLILSASPTIAEFDPANSKISSQPITFASSEKNPIDFKIYSDRIYVLDATSNQIYRHDLATNGYSEGTGWITSDSNIEKGVSLAIDGEIYVLTSNGEIKKFLSGEEQTFSIKGLDHQPLAGPSKIMTTIDTDNIYLIDPPTKRVVVLDKTGNMINQYQSDKFDDLRDIYADEANKKIYVLNNNSIYEIDI